MNAIILDMVPHDFLMLFPMVIIQFLDVDRNPCHTRVFREHVEKMMRYQYSQNSKISLRIIRDHWETLGSFLDDPGCT